MTTILDLDYNATGVAAADVPNWSGTMDVTGGSWLVLEAYPSTPESATRSLTGLTASTEYDVHVLLDSFDFGVQEATATVEGQTVVLAAGVNTVTFTATGTTADLVITATQGNPAGGDGYIYLNGLQVESGGPPPSAITITGTTSHLHDTVDIVGQSGGTTWDVTLATLPAYVGYQTAGIDNSEVGRTAFVESLRAILPACNFDATAHRIRWNGDLYMPNGPEMLRRRRGRDLTLTVPIKLVTG